MKADFDRYEPYDNRPEIIFGVVLVLVMCAVVPLMLYLTKPMLSYIVILAIGAVMVIVYMLAGRGKHFVEIDGEKITFTSGRKARVVSLDEISAAGYASEIVRTRIVDKHLYLLLHVEIRLKTGERIQLAKNLHPPKDVDTYKRDSYNAFVEDQPLPQLCRYINRQVLGIAEE